MHCTHFQKYAVLLGIEESQGGSLGLGEKLESLRLIPDVGFVDGDSQPGQGVGRPDAGNADDDVEGGLDQPLNRYVESLSGLLQAGHSLSR